MIVAKIKIGYVEYFIEEKNGEFLIYEKHENDKLTYFTTAVDTYKEALEFVSSFVR